MKRLAVVVLGLGLALSGAAAAVPPAQLSGTWVSLDDTYSFTFDTDAKAFAYRFTRNGQPEHTDGALQFAACGNNHGDAVLYHGSTQCCVRSEFVGARLVLSVVAGGSVFSGPGVVCANHVLERPQ
jgi:hypothetical protein